MDEEAIDRERRAGQTGQLPPFRYDAAMAGQIERRWQDTWDAAGTYDSPNPAGALSGGFDRFAGRPKSYVLDMFPYASGTGIHVGHPEGYIATDVFARYLRMTGYHVLHAMGFDAFGLPAEQFAVGTGRHPQATTRQNIDNMRDQLRRLGMGYDTRRSVETTDPGFYRWTQWIFLQIFGSWVDERTGRARPVADLVGEYASGQRPVPGGGDWNALTTRAQRELIDSRRLAYIAEEPVNWCPALGTVLANEEVTADGRSDIGNFPVYRRPMRQWMMRITAMAQRLSDDLDLLAWPENVKQQQRNWIGGSDGAVIWLQLAPPSRGQVEVFTTRPTRCPALPTWSWRPSTRWQRASYPMPGPTARRGRGGTRQPPAGLGTGRAMPWRDTGRRRRGSVTGSGQPAARSQECSPAATCLIPPPASRSPYS
jgi:leucyl-tRNA synthetase